MNPIAPALHPPRNFDFSLARQEWNGSHLAEIHPHGIVQNVQTILLVLLLLVGRLHLIDLGLVHSMVTKSGSWYSCGELRLGQGRDRAIEYLAEHPDLAASLRQTIIELVNGPTPAADAEAESKQLAAGQ